MRRKSPRANRSLKLFGVRGIAPRYIAFLQAYIRYHQETNIWNGAEAARAVGYSERHAAVQASRILSIPVVQTAWLRYIERMNQAAEIDPIQAEIEHLQTIHSVANFQLTDIFEYDGREVVFKPSAEWSPHARRAIKTVRQKEVTKVYEGSNGPVTERTVTVEFETHEKAPFVRMQGQVLGTLRSGATTMRLPGGQEIETDGDIKIYNVENVNHFEIPDNGRGPKPIGAGTTE